MSIVMTTICRTYGATSGCTLR